MDQIETVQGIMYCSLLQGWSCNNKFRYISDDNDHINQG